MSKETDTACKPKLHDVCGHLTSVVFNFVKVRQISFCCCRILNFFLPWTSKEKAKEGNLNTRLVDPVSDGAPITDWVY